MYDVLINTYWRPCTALDVHKFLFESGFYIDFMPLQKQQQWLHLYPALGASEIATIDIVTLSAKK